MLSDQVRTWRSGATTRPPSSSPDFSTRIGGRDVPEVITEGVAAYDVPRKDRAGDPWGHAAEALIGVCSGYVFKEQAHHEHVHGKYQIMVGEGANGPGEAFSSSSLTMIRGPSERASSGSSG